MSWRTILHRNAKTVWVISGFHREADENGALPGCYAASTGNLLPTFRAILSGPIIRGQESKKKIRDSLKMRQIGRPETS